MVPHSSHPQPAHCTASHPLGLESRRSVCWNGLLHTVQRALSSHPSETKVSSKAFPEIPSGTQFSVPCNFPAGTLPPHAAHSMAVSVQKCSSCIFLGAFRCQGPGPLSTEILPISVTVMSGVLIEPSRLLPQH